VLDSPFLKPIFQRLSDLEIVKHCYELNSTMTDTFHDATPHNTPHLKKCEQTFCILSPGQQNPSNLRTSARSHDRKGLTIIIKVAK
jgi:hypothetical protein